jgi:hypothetical protein
LSLISNNSESLAFSQLGATDGLHFLGPIRGVLPPGPLANGVPTLNTLSYPSVLDNTDPKAEKIYYNYTLDLQGLTSDIKCIYDTQSPVDFLLVPGGSPFVYQYTGTCSGLEDVLQNSTLIVPNSNHSLGFWACKVPGNSEQYLLYLRGRVDYENAIGNITCTLSTMQPAIFPVAYQSRSGYFSSQNYTTTFANTSSDIILRAIKGIGAVIYESQNTQSNLVAESVITFGVKSYDLPPNNQNETYLQLYGAMFQGILEYEVCPDALLHIFFPQYFITGCIHSHDIFETRSAPSIVLQPFRDRKCKLWGNWVVCRSQEHWFLVTDDPCHPSCLDTCDRSYDHGGQSSVRI